jgi:uncharacterized protein YpiB (UPF0302 family)
LLADIDKATDLLQQKYYTVFKITQKEKFDNENITTPKFWQEYSDNIVTTDLMALSKKVLLQEIDSEGLSDMQTIERYYRKLNELSKGNIWSI